MPNFNRPYRDRGTVLAVEHEKLLQYSLWSESSRLADLPQNRTLITVILEGADELTHLTVRHERSGINVHLFPWWVPYVGQQIQLHGADLQRFELLARLCQHHFTRRAARAIHHQINFNRTIRYARGAHHIQRDQRHPKRRMNYLIQFGADFGFSWHLV